MSSREVKYLYFTRVKEIYYDFLTYDRDEVLTNCSKIELINIYLNLHGSNRKNDLIVLRKHDVYNMIQGRIKYMNALMLNDKLNEKDLEEIIT